MKRTPIIFAVIIIFLVLCGCHKESIWEAYENWRIDNNRWYVEQTQKKGDYGEPYYTKLQPSWYPTSGVLIKYLNDRSLTKDNLSPMLTSYVDVKYKGELYNGMPFDSSYVNTEFGDSIYRCQVSSNITGWQLALCNMHVGDSCELIIPYPQAYGEETVGIIPPFSALKFTVKLVDIYIYEGNE